MPSTSIYLSGHLAMPNGSLLWADDICLEVEYDITRDYHHMFSGNPTSANVDFDVVDVTDDIFATDTSNNAEVVLRLDATHPAIRSLVKQKSRDIEDYCLDAASFEDA